MTTNMNLHAHVDTASRDCDGPMYREYTVFLTADEKAEITKRDGVNDFTGIHFRERVLGSQVSLTSCEFGVTVRVTLDGFTWDEPTEEGSRGGEVRWCEDETCGESYSQRDVYAEMAGY